MAILEFLQQIRNPLLDSIFKVFTLMGEDILIIAIICYFAWCKNKQFGQKLGLIFCVGMWVNQMIKITFCVPRPWTLNQNITPSALAVKTATGYSFPSGHTQSGVMLFGTLATYTKNKIAILLCTIVAIGIGVSRLYFGVHTVLDVLASIIIGVIIIAIVSKNYEIFKQKMLITTCTALSLAIILSIYAIIKSYPDGFNPSFISDCFKMSGVMAGFFISWFIENKYINYSTNAKKSIQIVKYFFGILVLCGLKLSFLYMPKVPSIYFLENFILIIWCILIYPMTFKFLYKQR